MAGLIAIGAVCSAFAIAKHWPIKNENTDAAAVEEQDRLVALQGLIPPVILSIIRSYHDPSAIERTKTIDVARKISCIAACSQGILIATHAQDQAHIERYDLKGERIQPINAGKEAITYLCVSDDEKHLLHATMKEIRVLSFRGIELFRKQEDGEIRDTGFDFGNKSIFVLCTHLYDEGMSKKMRRYDLAGKLIAHFEVGNDHIVRFPHKSGYLSYLWEDLAERDAQGKVVKSSYPYGQDFLIPCASQVAVSKHGDICVVRNPMYKTQGILSKFKLLRQSLISAPKQTPSLPAAVAKVCFVGSRLLCLHANKQNQKDPRTLKLFDENREGWIVLKDERGALLTADQLSPFPDGNGFALQSDDTHVRLCYFA